MALLAEQLVDEWLNRDGYFTIRGLKIGVNEIDILAIKPTVAGIEARHVEVQVSFNPISYISKLTKEQQEELGVKSSNSTGARPESIVKDGIKNWLDKKFYSKKKMEMRNRVLNDVVWKFSLVHAVLYHPPELGMIKEHGIELIPF